MVCLAAKAPLYTPLWPCTNRQTMTENNGLFGVLPVVASLPNEIRITELCQNSNI